MNHAQKFIEQMKIDQEKNNSEVYENVVIRVDQKYAAMITVLGSTFKFPTSTAFSDLLSKHLFDMVVAMDDDKYIKLMSDVVKLFPDSHLTSTIEIDEKSIDSLIKKEQNERFKNIFNKLTQ